MLIDWIYHQVMEPNWPVSSRAYILFSMKITGFMLCLILPLPSQAANINRPTSIDCVSDQSSLQARHQQLDSRKNSEKIKSWFSEWMMKESFGNKKSKIKFTWLPRSENGPVITIDTTDKAHNLIKLRSHTKHSLIVVSSASNPFSTESWTFAFNFQVETVVATRVQSNIGGVKGEVITYDCRFDNLESEKIERSKALS